MKISYHFIVAASLLVLVSNKQLLSNNVVASSVTTINQDVSAGVNNPANFTNIEFDINWDNSWRVSTGANNWDAVWVFAKYKIETGGSCTAGDTWYHCTLSTTGGHHSITTPNGIAGTITPSSDGKGVFMYRSGNGNGSIDWDDVRLRWSYPTDGLFDDCIVTIQVFAVEMVYVPQGSFYVGDGRTTGTLYGALEAGTTGAAFQVTGEGALTLGGGGAGSVGNNNGANMSTVDDFNDAATQTLPAAFPKGYDAYYCMKYEISQQQYVDFLNTLDGNQQTSNVQSTTVGNFYCNTNSASPLSRNGVKCKNSPLGTTPGEWVCDLDDDDTYNEATEDGMFTAMNWLPVSDLMAYLDWAALRPMTEFEYEKACRGTLAAVANEYAWGNTTRTNAAAISNSGAANETVTTASANCCAGNSFSSGPLRCGIFATGTSTRTDAGASYYGIMEMSGNVWEEVVLIGCAAGRSFTGVHGDGYLNSSGDADVDYWPGINGNNTTSAANSTYGGTTGCTGRAGISFTGGTFNYAGWLETSDRQYRGSGWSGVTGRDVRNGGRGVRTAP